MARECYFTGKKTQVGNNVSHAQNKSKRTFKPNLHKVKIMIGNTQKKVLVSAKHRRTLKKQGLI